MTLVETFDVKWRLQRIMLQIIRFYSPSMGTGVGERPSSPLWIRPCHYWHNWQSIKKMHFPAHLTKTSGLDGIHFSFYVRRKQLKTMNTCKHNNSGTSEKFISVASLGLVSPGAATNGFTPFFIQKPDDLFFSARWLRFFSFLLLIHSHSQTSFMQCSF